MVRRLLLVQKILGSNPSASGFFRLVAQLEERRFSKSECVSSILTQPDG